MIKAVKLVTALAFLVFAYNLYAIFDKIHLQRQTPVVTDFEPSEIVAGSGVLKISGNMVKVRDCDFKNAITYGSFAGSPLDRQLILTEFHDPQRTPSRALGPQSFGPWLIYHESFNRIQMYSRHLCGGEAVITQLWDYTLSGKDSEQ